MAIYGVLLALMLVMRFAPDSSIGKALNRQLVEVPLRVLGGMRRHHLIFLILIVALIYALDVSLYVDGLLVTLALASVARTRSVLTLLSAGAASLAVRMRRGS